MNELREIKNNRENNFVHNTVKQQSFGSSKDFNPEEFNSNDEDLEFEEYKSKLDKLFEEKKKALENEHQFQLIKIKQEEEKELKEIEKEHEKKKQKIDEDFRLKESEYALEIQKKFKNKEQEEKTRIQSLAENEDVSTNPEIKEKQFQIQELELEIENLKKKLNEEKLKKLNKSEVEVDDYTVKYAAELKKVEKEYEIELKEYEVYLENQLNEKKQRLKNHYLNKKLEYETTLKKQGDPNQNESMFLREQKDLIQKNHQAKIQQYKESLITYYQNQVDLEKEKLILENGGKLNRLKENYDRTKKLYEIQNMMYNAEQLLLNNNNLVNKLKTVFSNKNSIIKNLIEFSYYYLKKKLAELEQNDFFASLENKDELLVKIAEILSYILYEHIYDLILDELDNDRLILEKSVEDVTRVLEKIINCFPFQNKVQLTMLVLNPKIED